MILVLEVEFLTGVSFAALGPDSPAPDWPPQPDRIFSALVASWAARGQDVAEAEALEWLEALPAPRLLASASEPRSQATAFVPPNDPRSNRRKSAHGVLPMLRSRQPRRFPASRPHDPVVRLLWKGAPTEDTHVGALQRIAADTAYIGHSASLTRCRFVVDGDASAFSGGEPPDRRVYPGRFEELRGAFEFGRRPLPGARVRPDSTTAVWMHNHFDQNWLILEHTAGEMPDLRASALVAKTMRDALLSGYERMGLGDDIPEIVSGHGIDRQPTRAHHLAIVPMPFVGFPHADGHVMGIALVPPQESGLLDDETFRKVLREMAPMDEDSGRRLLTLKTREGTPSDRAFAIALSPTFEPPAAKRSLDPGLYTRSARVFATATPMVLDRHLKAKGRAREEEIEAQIKAACGNIGLPEPEAIVAGKHSAVEGSLPAYPSGNQPRWMRWRLPPSMASKQLTHAVIRFSEPVPGPVVLGAGRFVGMGLCRPLHPEA